MPGNTMRRYPPELKQRAVRMVAEIRGDHESEWAAMAKVAELLGVGTRRQCAAGQLGGTLSAGIGVTGGRVHAVLPLS